MLIKQAVGLFDELSKIAEAEAEQLDMKRPISHKVDWKRVIGTGLAASGGFAAGHGLGALLEAKIPALRVPTDSRVKVVKAALPILSGAAYLLGDRYTRKVDAGMRSKKQEVTK